MAGSGFLRWGPIWCGVSVASSKQILVLEAVVQLDRELTKILEHVDLLRVSPAQETINSLVRLRPAVVSAMREVHERVLASADDTPIECVERGLRARAAIVMVQLDELRAVERETETPLVNGGRFRSAPELGRYLTDRLGRVNANLLRERRELDATATDLRMREALYHIAVDNAEHGYFALGRDRDVEEFLRAGASSGSKRFRIACGTIAAALELVTIPDLPRLGPARAKRTQPPTTLVDKPNDGPHA